MLPFIHLTWRDFLWYFLFLIWNIEVPRYFFIRINWRSRTLNCHWLTFTVWAIYNWSSGSCCFVFYWIYYYLSLFQKLLIFYLFIFWNFFFHVLFKVNLKEAAGEIDIGPRVCLRKTGFHSFKLAMYFYDQLQERFVSLQFLDFHFSKVLNALFSKVSLSRWVLGLDSDLFFHSLPFN